jgi:hypothetical protein
VDIFDKDKGRRYSSFGEVVNFASLDSVLEINCRDLLRLANSHKIAIERPMTNIEGLAIIDILKNLAKKTMFSDNDPLTIIYNKIDVLEKGLK